MAASSLDSEARIEPLFGPCRGKTVDIRSCLGGGVYARNEGLASMNMVNVRADRTSDRHKVSAGSSSLVRN